MIILNDHMLIKFKDIISTLGISVEKFDRLLVPYSFIVKDGGIFIASNQDKIHQQENINDIPFWEFHVNRFDSDEIEIMELEPYKIISIMYQISKIIVKNFKLQFPDKKIILLLQYEEEYNLAKVFFHTVVNNDICDKKNVLTTESIESDICSLLIVE